VVPEAEILYRDRVGQFRRGVGARYLIAIFLVITNFLVILIKRGPSHRICAEIRIRVE
jgi:hypothetical protein